MVQQPLRSWWCFFGRAYISRNYVNGFGTADNHRLRNKHKRTYHNGYAE